MNTFWVKILIAGVGGGVIGLAFPAPICFGLALLWGVGVGIAVPDEI